jgi:hypothetical protein
MDEATTSVCWRADGGSSSLPRFRRVTKGDWGMIESSGFDGDGSCSVTAASGVCEPGIEITRLVAIGEGDGAATEGTTCELLD